MNFQADPENFWNVFYTVMYNFQADPGNFCNVFYTVMMYEFSCVSWKLLECMYTVLYNI